MFLLWIECIPNRRIYYERFFKLLICRIRSYRPKIGYYRIFYDAGVYWSSRAAGIASFLSIQADIVSIFTLSFFTAVGVEHSAVTGLTAQDVVEDASTARILGIIAPYAIISDNFLCLVKLIFWDYGLMFAFVKITVLFDFADI